MYPWEPADLDPRDKKERVKNGPQTQVFVFRASQQSRNTTLRHLFKCTRRYRVYRKPDYQSEIVQTCVGIRYAYSCTFVAPPTQACTLSLYLPMRRMPSNHWGKQKLHQPET